MSDDRFDLESVYDTEIAPLMAKVADVCQQHRLPMMATFVYSAQGPRTSVCSTYLTFDGRTPAFLDKAQRAIDQRYTPEFARITILNDAPPRNP